MLMETIFISQPSDPKLSDYYFFEKKMQKMQNSMQNFDFFRF